MSDEEVEEWEPSADLLVWADEHFKGISIGGVWSPEGSGVSYIRQDEKTYALMRMVDHPSAAEHHGRFKVLMEAVGYTLEEGDGAVMVPPAMTADENAKQEYEHKQAIAQGWQCECKFPLANFDLDTKAYSYKETKDVLTSEGQTVPVEVWSVDIICPNCDKDIEMDPDDYNLLAGDESFMNWKSSETDDEYIALTRSQVKDLADAGVQGVALGSMIYETGEKVPPWMWGTYCIKKSELPPLMKGEEE